MARLKRWRDHVSNIKLDIGTTQLFERNNKKIFFWKIYNQTMSYNCISEFKDYNNDTTAIKTENTPRIQPKDEHELKRKLAGPRRCNWKDCRNRTTHLCANSGCEKIACEKTHSQLVCVECAKKPFDRSNITKEPRKVSQSVCQVVPGCKIRTTRVCGLLLCDKPVCELHRYKLCWDCCFNSKFNFQVYN